MKAKSYIFKIYLYNHISISLFLHPYLGLLLFNFLISQFDDLKPSLANHVFTVASSQGKLHFVLSLDILNS